MPITTPRLTFDEADALFVYEPATGILRWKVDRTSTVKAGSIARGIASNGYPQVGNGGRLYYIHRLAWLLTHGAWPERDIDHINGDRQDNRLVNLRSVSRRVNSENQLHAKRNNKVGLLGVSRYYGGRFAAYIKVKGVVRLIGSFESAEIAHCAYISAKRELHEGCTL